MRSTRPCVKNQRASDSGPRKLPCRASGLGQIANALIEVRIFPENSGFLKAFCTSESVRELSLRVNGEEQHFEMRVFPLNRRTQHLGWAVIVSDITAQIELVQQLHHHAVTDSSLRTQTAAPSMPLWSANCARVPHANTPL
jgi:hypothetical protein